MLEIPPLSSAYPVIKPEKIKKDDLLSEQPQRKKKQVLEKRGKDAINRVPADPVQHIDEIV